MIRSLVQQRASSLRFLALCLGTLSMVGCGVLGGDQSHPAVAVTPAQAQVRAGNTQQFTATVTGVAQPSAAPSNLPGPHGPAPRTISDDQSMQVQRPIQHSQATSQATTNVPSSSEVTWSVNGVAGGNATLGTINSNGLYTAPSALPSNTSITVTATSVTNNLVSGEAAVSLENPIPVIQSAQPDPVTVGNFTLTVTGSKFVKGAEILLNGVALPTTFVSATKLTATGTATQAEVGKVTITVKNPDPGTIVSATSFSLQIDPPLTIAVKVSPATAQVREGASQQFSAMVSGTSNTAVTWSVNGVAGGNSSLGTVDTKGLYKAPAGIPNPNPLKVAATSMADTRATAFATTTVDYPVPTLASLSPQAVNVGNFTITATGTNFVNGAAVVFGGQLLTTTYVNGTQLKATGTATSQQVGSVQVVVQNPDPGSSDSNTLTEQVSA